MNTKLMKTVSTSLLMNMNSYIHKKKIERFGLK